MKEKVKIYESDYLMYELMPAANIDFVSSELTHIKELVSDESEWESYPEWMQYLSNRPIGEKPHPLNLDIKEFRDFLQRNNVSRLGHIEIVADDDGLYADEIRSSEIYGNSNYALIFSGQDNMIKYLCVIPPEPDEMLIAPEVAEAIQFILDQYGLILVDWNEAKTE